MKKSDKLNIAKKVVSSYLKDLVLHIPDKECYSNPQMLYWRVYKNNNIIGWLNKFQIDGYSFMLNRSIPESILTILGVDDEGHNFGDQTNHIEITSIIKENIINKISKYYSEIGDCRISFFSEKSIRFTKCKHWTKVNLY